MEPAIADPGDPPTAPAAALCVQGLASKGAGAQAQALLVFGCAPAIEAGEALWVRVDAEAAVSPLFSDRFRHDDLEPARPLLECDWRMLGVQDDDARRGFEQRHPIPEGQARWVARFDFSDHDGLTRAWARRVADDAASITVAAWRARLDRADDDEGQARQAYRLVGAVAVASRRIGEIDAVPLFELGVLFVHGIGPHRVRETLIRFGEPIVETWLATFRALTQASGRQLGARRAGDLQQRLAGLSLSPRQDLDGMPRMVDRLVQAAEGHAGQAGRTGQAAATEPTLACAWARAEDTLLADGLGDMPSATLLRLMRAERDASIHDAHVLMAEAWWVRDAVRPSSGELRTWLDEALPSALGAHVDALRRQARQVPAGTGLEATLHHVEWRLKLAVLPLLYTLLAVPQHALVALLGAFEALPLPVVQRASRALVALMMGTLGHSHALQTSPIRRNAIVRRVAAQLDWLGERCQRVAVIAHSQGAEVTRLALQLRRRAEVRRWLTFGAGIAPLALLERGRPPSPGDRRLRSGLQAASASLVATALAAALVAWPGLVPAAGAWHTLGQVAVFGCAATLLACILATWASLFDRPAAPWIRQITLRGRRSILSHWRNYFASHDPVPGGPLLDGAAPDFDRLGWPPGERPREFEIHNTRFGPTDHTRYLDNVEQFVAPVAVDLLDQVGLFRETPAVRDALASASRRRARLTLHHHWVRSALLLASPVLALAPWVVDPAGLVDRWGRVGAHLAAATSWLDGAQALWSSGDAARLALPWWPLSVLASVHLASAWLLRRRLRRSRGQLIDALAQAYAGGSAAGA